MATTADFPTEILVHIFQHALQGRPPTTTKTDIDSLRRVSTEWNEIILASPTLWTTICIPQLDVNYIRSASLALQRSKGCLLDVTFDLLAWNKPLNEHRTPTASREKLSGLVEQISTCSDRIGTMHLSAIHPQDGYSEAFWKPLLDLKEAPSLRCLCLSFYFANVQVAPIPLTLSAPALRHVSLRHAFLPLQELHRLSVLDLADMGQGHLSLSFFRDISQSCPMLSQLLLRDLWHLRSAPEDATQLVVLPLRSLCVQSSHTIGTPHRYITKYFQLPNLENLQLVGSTFSQMADLFPYGRQQFPGLRTLRFSRVQDCALDRYSAEFLTSQPITHLQLQELNVDDLMVCLLGQSAPQTSRLRAISISSAFRQIRDDGIGSREGASLLWPNVNTVTLDALRASDVAGLLNFLVSRPSIKTVHFSNAARRHLTRSLRILEVKDGRPYISSIPWRSDIDPVDCEAWLKGRGVQILPVESEFEYID